MAAAVKKTTTARKPTVKKAAQKPAKATSAPKGKKTTSTTPKASTRPAKAVKKTASKKVTTPMPTNMDFKPGSDTAYIWEEIQKGGASRRDVMDRISQHYAKVTTRGGKPKPVSTVMNYLIRRAIASGKYEIVSSWTVAPVVEETPKKTKVATSKPAAKKPAAPTKKAAPAKAAPKKAATAKPSAAKPSKAVAAKR